MFQYRIYTMHDGEYMLVNTVDAPSARVALRHHTGISEITSVYELAGIYLPLDCGGRRYYVHRRSEPSSRVRDRHYRGRITQYGT